MAKMTSNLPHWKNSSAANKYYEPFYTNLFEVKIILPTSINSGSSEILLEHVTRISGLNQDKGEGIEQQGFKFAKRSYAASGPEDTTLDITIGFNLNLNDANELYVYKILRDWHRLVYNPLTGEQGLKKDYAGDAAIVVTNYNRQGDIFWERTYRSVFPTGDMPEFDLDYNEHGIQEMEMLFKSDYWEENIV